MANTYVLIASNTLSSSAASVTFSSIPNTYTDLVLRTSARSTRSGIDDGFAVVLSSNTNTIYSHTSINGTGTAVQSDYNYNMSNFYAGHIFGINGNTTTSSTFSSGEFYIPMYASSNKKQLSFVGANETNATAVQIGAAALFWNSTSAITSISLSSLFGGDLMSGSSFFLYGIKNS